jgi:hypothetical protein
MTKFSDLEHKRARERAAAYRKAHPHEATQAVRRWKKANHRRVLELNKRWRNENAAQMKTIRKNWVRKNRARVSAKAKAWQRVHPDKVLAAKRLHKYGITPAQYAAMWDSQEGLCAICSRPAEVIDHDHQTGDVRGLLCDFCNKGLGFFRDDQNILDAASRYLGKARGGTKHSDLTAR